MTPRLPDWQARLGAVLESRRTAPFTWGTQDCAAFAADCVHACIGTDPLAPERGAYETAQEAAKRLDSYGGIEALGDALFGQPCPPLLARVGDTGLAEVGGRECLVVCNGTTWLGPGPEGLVTLPLNAAIRAWKA